MLWFAQGSCGLREALSAATIVLEISSRNARVVALQERWEWLRAGLELILDQRGANMADLTGGASGLLVRDYRSTEADRLVTRIGPRRGLAGRRTPRPRAPGGRGIGAVEDPRGGAQAPRRLAGHFPPPPSPSKSPAPTRASRRSKSAGIGCALARTWSSISEVPT
jgi:hypothetical protein